MKTCKDCLHYEACKGWTSESVLCFEQPECEQFADRSEWAEVKHGKWEKHYRSGLTAIEGYLSSCCNRWNNRNSNYCPHCGAKMDGDIE